MRKPEFSAISDPFASVTVTAAKFMAGEPIEHGGRLVGGLIVQLKRLPTACTTRPS